MNEDKLSRAFANKIKDSPEFASWVLGHTKFAEYRSSVRLLHEEQMWRRPNVLPENWWRHWWCRIPDLAEERETDIFLVFEITGDKRRFALHIENKKESAFLRGQAEAYKPRARYMMNNERWLSYADFDTVLVAPLAFRNDNRAKCDLFGCYISYEDIARFIPEFSP